MKSREIKIREIQDATSYYSVDVPLSQIIPAFPTKAFEVTARVFDGPNGKYVEISWKLSHKSKSFDHSITVYEQKEDQCTE